MFLSLLIDPAFQLSKSLRNLNFLKIFFCRLEMGKDPASSKNLILLPGVGSIPNQENHIT